MYWGISFGSNLFWVGWAAYVVSFSPLKREKVKHFPFVVPN
jgi:hypothetical protein